MVLIFGGCEWEPPHNNPVDPDHYNYQPFGRIHITVLEAESDQPLEYAEVRIPDLGRISFTDTSGILQFDRVPVGNHRIYAERRGDDLRAYGLDSLDITVEESATVRDTFHLQPLPPTPGSLSVQVLNLSSQPIEAATVLIAELGRFGLTDENGYISLGDIPTGEVWVSAFREPPLQPVYARDSLFVTINAGAVTYASFRLDALPFFNQALVNSITYEYQSQIIHKLILKARVEDPDGPADLQYIIYRFDDEENEIHLSDTLDWYPDPDSSFWWREISSEELPGGNIDNARNEPFYFEAFDADTNSAIAYAKLMHVIHNVPDLNPPDVNPLPRPTLRWIYYWRDEFADTTQFRYLLKVKRSEPEPVAAYDTLLVPISQSNPEHTLSSSLEPGNYYWYVWVIDNFGNHSRSQRGSIIGVPPE